MSNSQTWIAVSAYRQTYQSRLKCHGMIPARMPPATAPTTIAEAAYNCEESFHPIGQMCASLGLKSARSADALRRYRRWSAELGADYPATDPRSADHELRNLPEFRIRVLDLLHDLTKTNGAIIKFFKSLSRKREKQRMSISRSERFFCFVARLFQRKNNKTARATTTASPNPPPRPRTLKKGLSRRDATKLSDLHRTVANHLDSLDLASEIARNLATNLQRYSHDRNSPRQSRRSSQGSRRTVVAAPKATCERCKGQLEEGSARKGGQEIPGRSGLDRIHRRHMLEDPVWHRQVATLIE